jgi:hypothetical protein
MGPEILPSLVAATLELYRHVTTRMLPVPSRPHYLFSIRHVASVFKVWKWVVMETCLSLDLVLVAYTAGVC